MSESPGLSELEIRIAYQDDTIEQLGGEVYRQSQAIARLEAQCRALEQQVARLRETKQDMPMDDERPPHY